MVPKVPILRKLTRWWPVVTKRRYQELEQRMTATIERLNRQHAEELDAVAGKVDEIVRRFTKVQFKMPYGSPYIPNGRVTVDFSAEVVKELFAYGEDAALIRFCADRVARETERVLTAVVSVREHD